MGTPSGPTMSDYLRDQKRKDSRRRTGCLITFGLMLLIGVVFSIMFYSTGTAWLSSQWLAFTSWATSWRGILWLGGGFIALVVILITIGSIIWIIVSSIFEFIFDFLGGLFEFLSEYFG
ncbi:MAG: hypothetical protein AAF702_01390 [Chloroflexota bacterium]